jgi:hypothetical protein
MRKILDMPRRAEGGEPSGVSRLVLRARDVRSLPFAGQADVFNKKHRCNLLFQIDLQCRWRLDSAEVRAEIKGIHEAHRRQEPVKCRLLSRCCRQGLRATDTSPAGVKAFEAEADRAMAWMQQAVSTGYKKVAMLKKDEDLDALRDRADFRKLLADLETAVKRDEK